MRVTKYNRVGSTEENLPFIAEVLRRNLRSGTDDTAVRAVAEQIIKGVGARNYLGEIRAIHDWVKGHIRYTGDPYGAELIRSPRRMLIEYATRRVKGEEPVVLADCDESSLLAASLLRSVGHRARIALMDTMPFSTDISHAIAQIEYPRWSDNWVFLETTQDRELGWTPNHTRVMCVE